MTAGRYGWLGAHALDDLRDAWLDYRWYVVAAFALFVFGVPVGVALWLLGVDLLAILGQGSVDDVFPSEITAAFIIGNNTRVFVLLILGTVTLGLLTVASLLVNGLLIGYFAAPVAAEQGVGIALVALVPHGIPELFAFFVAAGVAFRLVRRAGERLLGRRDVVLGRAGWRRTVLLLLVAWLVLVLAAFIEVYLTLPLVERLTVVTAPAPSG